MKICVVGTGYVGLVTGVCMADLGNDVICVDIDEKKIANLNKNILPNNNTILTCSLSFKK